MKTIQKSEATNWTRVWTVRAERWMNDFSQPTCSHEKGLAWKR